MTVPQAGLGGGTSQQEGGETKNAKQERAGHESISSREEAGGQAADGSRRGAAAGRPRLQITLARQVEMSKKSPKSSPAG
jgi:hypothetical protein